MPLGFLLVIVVVGGLIAYVCDNLGKKLGKKRLSLWGLRPRHTAALGTVVAGMIISVLTIGLVAFSSKDVRDWITKGAQALQDLRKTRADLEQESFKLRDVQDKADRSKREVSVLQGEMKKDEKTLDLQRKRIASQQERINVLFSRQRELEAKRLQTAQQIRVKDAEIQKKTAQIKTVQDQLSTNKNRLASSQKALGKTNASLQSVVKQYEAALSKQLEMDQQNEALSKQKEALQASLTDLQGQKTQLLAEQASLQRDLDSFRQRLSDARKELEQTQNEVAYYQQIERVAIVPSRTRPMIYRQGEEVVRLSIPANVSQQQAQQAINSLLNQARAEAQIHGAHALGKAPVASFNGPEDETPEQIEKGYVDQIAGKKYEQVVIARSYLNAFESEPISLDLAISENPIIFHRGDVIAQSQINGGGTRHDISEQLLQFVGVVKSRAIAHKMIPRPGAEAFGSVSYDQMSDLIDGLKQAGHPVTVQALALMDTYAADPLKLDFRIR